MPQEDKKTIGHIVSVKDYIVRVEFLDVDKPFVDEILVLAENPTSRLQVHKSASPNVFFCLALSPVTIRTICRDVEGVARLVSGGHLLIFADYFLHKRSNS